MSRYFDKLIDRLVFSWRWWWVCKLTQFGGQFGGGVVEIDISQFFFLLEKGWAFAMSEYNIALVVLHILGMGN